MYYNIIVSINIISCLCFCILAINVQMFNYLFYFDHLLISVFFPNNLKQLAYELSCRKHFVKILS